MPQASSANLATVSAEQVDAEFEAARANLLARGQLTQFVEKSYSMMKRALALGDRGRALHIASVTVFPALVTGNSELAEECLSVAESKPSASSLALRRARGFAEFLKGNPITWEQAARETADEAQKSDDKPLRIIGLRLLGLALYFQKRPQEADNIFADAQRLCEEVDDVANRTEILCWRARIALEAGEVTAANTLVEYATRVAQANDTTAGAVLAITQGLLCEAQDRQLEAEASLRQAVELANATEFGNIRADAAIVFARFLAARGRPSEAAEAIIPTKAWLEKSGYRFLDPQLSEVDLLLGSQRA